jgi:DNA/RNA-binding domain of Phe-tRNA-synthetase-like protein
MNSIHLSPELKNSCPALRLGCIEANVLVRESSPALLAEMDNRIRQMSESLSIESISKIPAIASSRKAYKAFGKDPARYRLSAEALLRRVVSGKGLYQINNVVDQLNLVSISTGFSIGGYDADKIQGDVVLGIGRADEPYSGIGRGELNIEYLPVFRDAVGAFGTPTSDSSRTGVTAETKRFLMVIIDFGGEAMLDEALKMAELYLTTHCSAEQIEFRTIA